MPTTHDAVTTVPALTGVDVARTLIVPMTQASRFLAESPTIIDSSRPVSLPRLAGADEPAWVAEGEQIPEVDLQFDSVNLAPKRGIKSISRITNEALRASVIGLSEAVSLRLVTDNSTVLDRSLFTGDGTGGSVIGLTNQPGTLVGPTLDLTDADAFFDALAVWESADADTTRGRWFLNPMDWVSLRKAKASGTGMYLIQADPTLAGRRTIDGLPVVVTSRIPQGTCLLVDMSRVVVLRDLAARVDLLVERYAEYDETGVRVVSRWDLGLLDPRAVMMMTAPAPV